MNNNWKTLNTLPAGVRRKTTPQNRKIYEALLPVTEAKKISRSPSQVENSLDEEESLYYHIKSGYIYGTLDGLGLFPAMVARRLYRQCLAKADFAFANMYITVWLRDDWRMLGNVYSEL